jgi:hypothetical protein
MKRLIYIVLIFSTNFSLAFGQTKTCLLGPDGIKQGARWISASINSQNKMAYLHGWNPGGEVFSYLWDFPRQRSVPSKMSGDVTLHWDTQQFALSGGPWTSYILVGDFNAEYSIRMHPFQNDIFSPTFSADGKTLAVLSSTQAEPRGYPYLSNENTLSVYDTKAKALISSEIFSGSMSDFRVSSPYFDKARNKFLVVRTRFESSVQRSLNHELIQVDPKTGQISEEVFSFYVPIDQWNQYRFIKLHAVIGNTIIFSTEIAPFDYLQFYRLDEQTKRMELEFGRSFKDMKYISHFGETVMVMSGTKLAQSGTINFISTTTGKVTQVLEIKDKLTDGYFDDGSVTYLNEQGHLCTVER